MCYLHASLTVSISIMIWRYEKFLTPKFMLYPRVYSYRSVSFSLPLHLSLFLSLSLPAHAEECARMRQELERMSRVNFVCVAYRNAYDMRVFLYAFSAWVLEAHNTQATHCSGIAMHVKFKMCGSYLYSIECMWDRVTVQLIPPAWKICGSIFLIPFCYRNNVVCLKCMPYEQNAVWNGTNLYDSISLCGNNVKTYKTNVLDAVLVFEHRIFWRHVSFERIDLYESKRKISSILFAYFLVLYIFNRWVLHC